MTRAERRQLKELEQRLDTALEANRGYATSQVEYLRRIERMERERANMVRERLIVEDRWRLALWALELAKKETERLRKSNEDLQRVLLERDQVAVSS